MRGSPSLQPGLTLTETMAVLTIIGILAMAIVPRTESHCDQANCEACEMHQANIELQAQLWYRNHGSFPTADLSDIKTDLDYFTNGLPTCPVDGTPYTIDTTTGTVTGHTH